MAVAGPRAMESHEPCQVREEAAVSGPFHVPRCILAAVINEDCKAFYVETFFSSVQEKGAVSFPKENTMAYLALYRKWRPQTFSEVVGQKHISLPLQRAVLSGRLAHAYLFSGPRGTGKTSMAKILAKAVNCEHPDGANPCNHCRNCEEITSGASLDVYEIDAASNRGIEEIRALKESVRTLPSVCRKKVYIIDEVHMLTKEAFNALLKTLEEPPEHVLFILATTEPEKIPLTILSRCQRYEFRRISVEDIKEHLLHIAKASGFSLTEEAADLIAIRAEGGLRDALSLLDQCSSAADTKELTAPVVYDLLGLTGKEQILSLTGHILRRESGAALAAFSAILQEGKEPALVLTDLLSHFRDVMLAKINPDAPELTIYGAQKPALLKEAASLPEDYLDALFESLHGSLSETKRSVSPRMNAEMGLLRLCRIQGSRSLEGLIARVEALERQLAQGGAPAASIGAPLPGPASFQFPAAPVPPTQAPSAPEPAPVKAALEGPAPTYDFEAPPEEVPPPEEEWPESAAPEEMAPAPAEMIPQQEPQQEPVKETPPQVPAKTAPPAKVAPKAKRKAPASPSQAAPANAAAPAGQDPGFIAPAEYPALWKKVLAYFQSIHRVDVFVCFGKCELIYASAARAVIVSAQPFIMQACNTEAYQKITAEAFQKLTGHAMLPRAVLKGSPEEAEARIAAEEASKAPASAAKAPQKAAPLPAAQAKAEGAGFERIREEDIPAKDRTDPLLAAALKIAPDCDIYEKK